MTDRPCIAVVGGFLGAGKTTLILAAARELSRRGLKSAIILNDQGDSLVDTQLARQSGFDAGEVTGGCFCCQFSSLIDSARELRAHSQDVIFAEPVGSCTDIAATVLHPLRELYTSALRLLPFTVCVDPSRALEIEAPDANPHLAFLFRNQLAEADLVCYTKSDLYPDAPQSPNARYVSAQTGQGVAAWLDEILFGQLPIGAHTLNIDYSEYARAEAALAWLNLSATIECTPAISPAMLLGPLLDRIAAGLTIVHLKATDHCESGFLKAAMCSSQDEPHIEGALDASPSSRHEVLLNLRAAGDPDPVRAVVEASIAQLKGRVFHQQIACFTPAPPKRPT
jgi:CobW/HypB/UreG, nucleotide-binding domain